MLAGRRPAWVADECVTFKKAGALPNRIGRMSLFGASAGRRAERRLIPAGLVFIDDTWRVGALLDGFTPPMRQPLQKRPIRFNRT
jgi:hypothetical protein